jgi:DNA-binding transcriptional ArsR family regulator
MVKHESDALDRVFHALSDPTRRAILERLGRGEETVGELAAPFDMSLPAVSKHLKVLTDAGLIAQVRRSRYRACRLEAKRLKQASAWVEQYRRYWEESLDRLDEYLKTVVAQDKERGKGKKDGR